MKCMKTNHLNQVLQNWQVHLDFVPECFSMFESEFTSHGKRHHLFVSVLGVKIAEYGFFSNL